MIRDLMINKMYDFIGKSHLLRTWSTLTSGGIDHGKLPIYGLA